MELSPQALLAKLTLLPSEIYEKQKQWIIEKIMLEEFEAKARLIEREKNPKATIQALDDALAMNVDMRTQRITVKTHEAEVEMLIKDYAVLQKAMTFETTKLANRIIE